MLALRTFILTNIETDKHFQTFHAQFHCDILKIWIALVFLYSIKKKDIYFKIIKKNTRKKQEDITCLIQTNDNTYPVLSLHKHKHK